MIKEHIVIFPFMAKGHTIPLLHLAAALSLSNLHLRLTMVTTPANAPFLRRSLPPQVRPDVDILLLPFPHSTLLPPGCESTDNLPSSDLHPPFVGAAALLREPFELLLRGLMRSSDPPPPLCLISDFFLWWALDLCRDVGLPGIVFHGMSAFSMAACKSVFLHIPHNLPVPSDEDEPFHVPGTQDTLQLTRRDLPGDLLQAATNPLDPAMQFMARAAESDVNSWGVLVNSFSGVDGGEYVDILDSFYRKAEDADYASRAWLVGPLALLSESLLEEERKSTTSPPDPLGVDECLEWLNKKKRAPGSVVYVSFGTQAHLSPVQLDEVARGLEESGYEYIWAVRRAAPTKMSWWSPPPPKKKGMIVEWAPQGEVLRHEATGGFVSHCGWNSVLEGVSAGVPLLTWPMIAEQHLNSKHVVEELGAGIELESTGGGSLVGREEVRDGVRELMGGERGRRARERAEELADKARLSVSDGGSSRRTLAELVEELRRSEALRLQRNSGAVSSSKGRLTVEVEERQLPFQLRDQAIA